MAFDICIRRGTNTYILYVKKNNNKKELVNSKNAGIIRGMVS